MNHFFCNNILADGLCDEESLCYWFNVTLPYFKSQFSWTGVPCLNQFISCPSKIPLVLQDPYA